MCNVYYVMLVMLLLVGFLINELWVIVACGLLVGGVGLGVSGYFLPRLRRVLSNEREAAGVVSDILIELRSRLLVQDKKITDIEVKLGLLDVKFDRVKTSGEGGGVTLLSRPRDVISRVVSEPGRNPVPPRSLAKAGLTQTEQVIVELLSNNSLTPTQIRDAIGKSREHTSRIMKSLFEKGKVERNDLVRPFVYSLRST